MSVFYTVKCLKTIRRNGSVITENSRKSVPVTAPDTFISGEKIPKLFQEKLAGRRKK